MNKKEYKVWLNRNKRLFQPIIELRNRAKDVKRPWRIRETVTLPNGYTTRAEWKALEDCWLGYKISKHNDDLKLQQWYAAGIQRFCNDLNLKVPTFPELKMLALSFYQDNADYLPDDLNPQQVFEIMLKNDFDYLKKQLEERGDTGIG